MVAIVAIDNRNGIGKDGHLLFHIRDDMRHFRNLTMDKIVVMGRKTFESLPNKEPLPHRENYIITRQKDYAVDGAHVVHSVDELIEQVGESDDVCIIGGGEIYEMFLPYYNRLYVTRINANTEADTFFFNIDREVWKYNEAESSDLLYDDKSNCNYSFDVLDRVK